MSDPIQDAIVRLATERGPGKSICPSEVARSLDPDWRKLMTAVRRAAITLAGAGRIDILRKGKPTPLDQVRGVIRLRLREDAP